MTLKQFSLRTFLLIVAIATIESCGKDADKSFSTTARGETVDSGNEGGNGSSSLDDDGILPGEKNHYDIDIFQKASTAKWEESPAYHVHAYDKHGGYSEMDFSDNPRFKFHASFKIKSCEGDLVRYKVRNASKASGVLKLKGGDEDHLISGYPNFAAPMLGMEEYTFATHLESKSKSIKFSLKIDKADLLIETRPSKVAADKTNRAGAFTLQVFCGDILLWEFVAYQHTAH